jgi:hypothetical protein
MTKLNTTTQTASELATDLVQELQDPKTGPLFFLAWNRCMVEIGHGCLVDEAVKIARRQIRLSALPDEKFVLLQKMASAAIWATA